MNDLKTGVFHENKADMKLTFDPTKPLPPKLQLCVHCKYFVPPQPPVMKLAKCRQYGEVDLVDGSVTFAAVAVVRESYCKGHYYVEKRDRDVF